jgi:hypothetical protein
MSSKRYVVFSNDNGTDAELVQFEWPVRKSDGPGGLRPVGIAYDHDAAVYGDNNKVAPNVVGKTISGNPEVSDLVGKVLTIADAMLVDKEQREAFKSLLRQAIYGYANDKEEQVRQIFLSAKHVSNKQ